MTNQNTDATSATTTALRTRWRVIGGWVLVGVGALFLLLGWIGVSGEPELARQFSYLASGGLGGLAAVIVGVGLLISEDLRSERRRLGRIESTLLDVRGSLVTENRKGDGRKAVTAASRRRRRG